MIRATTIDAVQLMTEGIIALTKASQNGIAIDVKNCKKQEKILGLKLKKLISEFQGTRTGILWKRTFPKPNFNSDAQLRDILFKKLKIKAIKRTTPSKLYPEGQESVDNNTLEILSKVNSDLDFYIKYKKNYKTLNTYISGILKEQVNGRLHPFFHLHLVKTFRSSSSAINFQNQPNRDKEQKKIIRSNFIPSKGNQLLAADFGGIEVCISCCNHKDPKMIKYVKDKKTDMHRDMCIQLYQLDKYEKKASEETLRKGTKNGYTFPQFYGDYYKNNAPILLHWGKMPTTGSFKKEDGLPLMTGITLGQHLLNKGIRNYEDFEEHVKKVQEHFWNVRFKVYNQWKKDNVTEYYKTGILSTLTGFTCSGMMSQNEINNYPVQGPAFHCTLKTFIETTFRMESQHLKSKLIGQIHDELVFDVHPAEKDYILDIIRKVACIWLRKQWPWIIVPLEIECSIYEVDGSWATKATKLSLAA